MATSKVLRQNTDLNYQIYTPNTEDSIISTGKYRSGSDECNGELLYVLFEGGIYMQINVKPYDKKIRVRTGIYAYGNMSWTAWTNIYSG